ncbi:hypothetical protein HYALB_00009945 [Hymenoscyphus albidus]|uniref:Uncharacterized protein n=1 Tax=Hymenoscyphus albidus TaxID=595503 RepID=A0A9N9LM92_9HELO|nr:hypothetical protein HYALB_00009945 [Hymenoscyphus albidus]
MHSKNIALVFALTLSTLTEASPVAPNARFALKERDQESTKAIVAREPFKFGKILKGAGSLLGFAGFALPFLSQSVPTIEVPSNVTVPCNMTASSNVTASHFRKHGGHGKKNHTRPFTKPFRPGHKKHNDTTLSPIKIYHPSLAVREPKFKFGKIAKGAGALLGLSALLPFLSGNMGAQSLDGDASPSNSTAAINGTRTHNHRRSDESNLMLAAFRDDIIIADPIVMMSPSVGSSVSIKLDCGDILVTLLQQQAFTCSFGLPADMPAGTLTGQNPGKAVSFEVPGACKGTDFGVVNTCKDCAAPAIVDCHGTVGASANQVELCVNGSDLAEC